MIKILKNKAVFGLLGSTFFQVLGISLFNMILLILAKSSNQPSLWVTIASIASTIPGVLSAVLGKIAGDLTNKAKWVILLTFTQSAFFLVLFTVFLSHNPSELGIAIGINLVSDIVGVVIGLLKLPIIQNKVPKELRQQTIGFYDSIGLIMQPIGQAIGLSYIASTGNYILGSFINATTFFISGCILFLSRKNLSYVEPKRETSEKSGKGHGFKKAFSSLGNITGLPIIRILGSLVILNALGASIDGILNLYILEHPQVSPLGFGLTILIINIIFVFGNVLGSVIVHDFLKNTSIQKLLLLAAGLLGIFFIILMFNLSVFVIIIVLFSIMYVLGKINPKLSAMLMDNVDSASLSTILGILNSSLTVATPIGSIFLVGGYTLIGKNPVLSISLFMIMVVIILLSIRVKPKELG